MIPRARVDVVHAGRHRRRACASSMATGPLPLPGPRPTTTSVVGVVAPGRRAARHAPPTTRRRRRSCAARGRRRRPRCRCPTRCASSTATPTTSWPASSTSTAASPASLTLEDLAEELVGEITDEHDPATPDASRPWPTTASGSWPATCTSTRSSAPSGGDLPRGDYETIAGLVIAEHGALPDVGRRPSTSRCRPTRADLAQADEPEPRLAARRGPRGRAARAVAGPRDLPSASRPPTRTARRPRRPADERPVGRRRSSPSSSSR